MLILNKLKYLSQHDTGFISCNIPILFNQIPPYKCIFTNLINCHITCDIMTLFYATKTGYRSSAGVQHIAHRSHLVIHVVGETGQLRQNRTAQRLSDSRNCSASGGSAPRTHFYGSFAWLPPPKAVTLDPLGGLNDLNHHTTEYLVRDHLLCIPHLVQRSLISELTNCNIPHVTSEQSSSNRLQLWGQWILRMFVLKMLFVCFWIRHLCLHHIHT